VRFLRVRADAFGPFPANATLDLAPGMNVIFGPNEAGKSSWHAALYAGLCGVRRARGPILAPDQRFEELHRPWGGSRPWAVTAFVALDDGTEIELRHDLNARTAQVSDRVLGRPFPHDLVGDGAPDGARLLGLDRRAFLATACVRQAELLGVRDSAAHLQQYLQQAVATGAADGTAGVLPGLGTARPAAGSTRPLARKLRRDDFIWLPLHR